MAPAQADDVGDLSNRLREDDGIGRLVRDERERVGVLAADCLAIDEARAELIAEIRADREDRFRGGPARMHRCPPAASRAPCGRTCAERDWESPRPAPRSAPARRRRAPRGARSPARPACRPPGY